MTTTSRSAGLALTLVGALIGCDVDTAVDPGPPVGLRLHRLNGAEYANSLEAVLGVDSEVAHALPVDPPSNGFDNGASSLTTSPLLLELYAQATDEVVDGAFGPGGTRAGALDGCLVERDELDCATEMLDELATLAWRRPLTDVERDRLLAVYDEARALGLDVDEALGASMRAALLSPNFLFRAEGTAPANTRVHVDAFELASRLSFFLWSGPPDEALLADAESGALIRADVLRAHAERMLDDPRAEALADNFAGQWLAFRYLDDVFKDTARYPAFDAELRASMAQEPKLLFQDLLARDADLRALLTSDETFVDARLAELYGLAELPPGHGDAEFVRVSLAQQPRRGVLTQAGLLSVLAYPFTTSPARRGAWVLGSMLCEPPPPPPPGVDVPVDLDAADKREAFALHRANPVCASCHESIDGIGLAYEAYDAIGVHRPVSGEGDVVDTRGQLPSGVTFDDPVDMATAIADDPAFLPCVVRQTMTYALGRELDERELDEVEVLAMQLADRGHGLRELFVLTATSQAMRLRHTEPSEVSP